MVIGNEQGLINLRIYLYNFAVFLTRQPTLEPCENIDIFIRLLQ